MELSMNKPPLNGAKWGKFKDKMAFSRECGRKLHNNIARFRLKKSYLEIV